MSPHPPAWTESSDSVDRQAGLSNFYATHWREHFWVLLKVKMIGDSIQQYDFNN